jgi:hypothetical protein
MAAATRMDELERRDQLDEVLRWRLRRLLQSGCTEDEARALAARPEVDLHRAVELLERGCPPELAVRILT